MEMEMEMEMELGFLLTHVLLVLGMGMGETRRGDAFVGVVWKKTTRRTRREERGRVCRVRKECILNGVIVCGAG